MSEKMNIRRIFAIQSKDYNRTNELIETFCSQRRDDSVMIYVFGKDVNKFSSDRRNVNAIEFSNSCDNDAKEKNYILEFFEKQHINGFLHLVDDTVQFFKNPSSFIQSVENTMDFLDYDIYFSTVTDPCNYIYSKFNPRITIDIDDNRYLEKGLTKAISFTSHSNISYTIWNLGKLGVIPKFDDRFSIAMYMIIEFLARRKSTKQPGQLYYMNQYLSVEEENKTFGTIQCDNQQIDPKQMQSEDALFKSLNVNYAPDNNIDIILDSLYAKMLSKN